MTDSRQELPDAFDRLLEYVQSSVGFETGFYNDAYLDRRITARMRRVGTESYEAYRRYLEDEPAEHQQLLDSLSINVTGFFRNPEAWDGIRRVLRTLTDECRSVDVWSTPCADGREPYSVAMLARDDPEIAHARVSILGTDISEEALEQAREGVYETSQTADIAEELEPLRDADRYVDRDGDRFCVRDPVTDLVTFERHDLIRRESKEDFDLVLCRNLLIYIDSAYKVPIFETIEASLSPGGYLVIGMTETIPRECRETFDPVDKRHRIYRTA
jgi:chemotaxis protein methyltransferase CheR